MNTEIENYLNHKKISKFNPKVQKYLSNLLSKFLLSIIFLMVSITALTPGYFTFNILKASKKI